MSKRDTIESRILSYFETCNADIGTMVFGLVQGVARRRGLTGGRAKAVAQKTRVAKPNGAVVVTTADNPSHHGA